MSVGDCLCMVLSYYVFVCFLSLVKVNGNIFYIWVGLKFVEYGEDEDEFLI